MIFLVLLFQHQTLTSEARPHFSGFSMAGLDDQDHHDLHHQQQKLQGRLSHQDHDQVPPPWWLSEDYSLPRRRRPVHNSLQH
ncbi:hypothetical protein PanWU01x14_124390 [Parasponia andersonii]|uniref:Uncharacterized protein n=1 Tax=Parasponia andersonii TaxID=3476 RepID=A0A2P5CTJ0_PARAD|nr:hypothetical protein PanWU01x14_124390 [Parasponia andersonii]